MAPTLSQSFANLLFKRDMRELILCCSAQTESSATQVPAAGFELHVAAEEKENPPLWGVRRLHGEQLWSVRELQVSDGVSRMKHWL